MRHANAFRRDPNRPFNPSTATIVAKPEPPKESWWLVPEAQFSDAAKREAERMNATHVRVPNAEYQH